MKDQPDALPHAESIRSSHYGQHVLLQLSRPSRKPKIVCVEISGEGRSLDLGMAKALLYHEISLRAVSYR